jgi:hypothetical protein
MLGRFSNWLHSNSAGSLALTLAVGLSWMRYLKGSNHSSVNPDSLTGLA